jgi:hypothetical protein
VKWFFMTVLVVVAGAVAGFAIWTFRGKGGSSDERSRASQYGRELATEMAFRPYTLLGTSRIAAGIWRVVYSARGRPNICFTIDLERFRFSTTSNGTFFPRGVATISCDKGSP